MRAALLGVVFLLPACTLEAVGPGPGDDTGGDDPPIVTGEGEKAGAITADETWSGTITLVGNVTIEPGATVTIAAGTELLGKDGLGITVEGSLVVAGTAEAPVTMGRADGAQRWAGIVAAAGGAVQIAYAEGTDVATLLYCHDGAALCHLDHVDFSGISSAIIAEGVALVTSSRIVDIANGGLTVRGAGGDLTVRDSVITTSTGDLVVQTGGTLLVEYSEIGDTQGVFDHCNFHIGAAASLTITRTNIINGVYGMMLGGTSGASITYNNWTGNTTDLSEVGVNTAVDLTNNYWANGAPALGAAYDVSSPAPAPIADAGPRS